MTYTSCLLWCCIGNIIASGDIESLHQGSSKAEQQVIAEGQKGRLLEPNLLELLGNIPTEKPLEGPPVHEAIVFRWTSVLKDGLNDETKQDLLQKHLPPENLKYLQVPKINPEVQAALSTAQVAQVLRRDERLAEKQKLLIAGASAVAQTLSGILEKPGEDYTMHVQSLSNAGRLLCDLLHTETITRRELISINLNKNFRDTLSDAPADNFLFGQALEERVKSAKNLEKASEDLKQPKQKKIPKMQVSLNTKGPAHQVQRGARVGQTLGKAPYYRPKVDRSQPAARRSRAPARDPQRPPTGIYTRRQY